jgi:hypothetical protein
MDARELAHLIFTLNGLIVVFMKFMGLEVGIDSNLTKTPFDGLQWCQNYINRSIQCAAGGMNKGKEQGNSVEGRNG